MRILHYIPSIDRKDGGTSTYMQLLGKSLGLLADVHIMTHKTDNPLRIENCNLHYIPHYKPFSGKWEAAVSDILTMVEPDIVHINCCWIPDCAAIQRLAQRSGHKVVLSPHGMLEPWIIRRHYLSRKLPALLLYQKAAVRHADHIHSTADSEKENLLKLGYNKNIEVVGLGIDSDNITIKKSWAKTHTILFLSRVHKKKGVDFLIQACSILRKELDGYNVIIAGEGDTEYVAHLKMKIAEESLGDVVKLAGGVYGEEKWSLIQSADFFVLPTYSENFGLAVAESLASGTPVITTDGTPWQDVDSHDCGIWTNIGAQPLAEAMSKMIACTESDLERMGRNGRALIEQKYSANVMAERMMKLYDSVLKRPSSPQS